ncbi:uncharacterized protein LOC128210716 [Mya arenaria]|nr:uncharacterized protein LOC128210716 [Mya arenaria]
MDLLTVKTVFVIVLSAFQLVTSFPSGPPRSACVNLLPVHMKGGQRLRPQNTSCPYSITVNVTSYGPGSVISIRVHSYVRAMFRGLMLQVRPLPNKNGESYKDEPLGTYIREVENVRMMTCGNSLDTIAHKDGFSKIEAKFVWTAPLMTKNDVQVTATILKNFTHFWSDVKSPPIRINREPGTQLPVETLEKPWVKEIVMSAEARNDKKMARKLVKDRFEKGLKGVVDPNGYIMVSYVADLLPFEDRWAVAQQVITSNLEASQSLETSLDVTEDEFDTKVRRPGAIGIEVPVGIKVVEGNSTVGKSDYVKFLREVIHGDHSHIKELTNIVEDGDQGIQH